MDMANIFLRLVRKMMFFFVESLWLEGILRTTDINEFENLRYIEDLLKKIGVIDRLKEEGMERGDTVYVCGHAFNFF